MHQLRRSATARVATIRRAIALTGVLAVIASVALPATAAGARSASSTAGGTVLLSSQVVPGLDAMTDLGATSPLTHMQIGISITNPHEAAIEAAYTAINTVGSPSYHHYLTPAGYAAAFGVPAATEQSIASLVTRDGLAITYRSDENNYLLLDGTAAQVEKTFDVTLHQYLAADGKVYRANPVGATAPAGVQAVLGLTTFDTLTTAVAQSPKQSTCEATECLGALTPQDLWSTYDQPAADTGAGQKIAIMGDGDLSEVVRDLRTFERWSNVPEGTIPAGYAGALQLPQVPVVEHLIDDPQTAAADTSGEDEWALDSQSSTGMAPDLAELDFYFAAELNGTDIPTTFQAWADDPTGPEQGNASFGACEPLFGLLGIIGATDPILRQLVMEGRTTFVSTGDAGSGSCPASPVNGVNNGGAPTDEYPATSPYVVGVGATTLYDAATVTPPSTTSTQVEPATRSIEYAVNYTGGGPSAIEPEPADQDSITLIKTPCTLTAADAPVTTVTTCRGLPDVSALGGDIVTNGYGIWQDSTFNAAGYPTGGNTQGAGTSLASPLWAGMWTRIHAAHPATCTSAYTPGSTALGFAQPDLYAVGNDPTADAADFFDVGNLDGTSLPNGNGVFTALPRSVADPQGWDFVSGLGVPDVTNLAKSLDCGSVTSVATDPASPAPDTVTVAPLVATGCTTNVSQNDPPGDETPTDTALDLTNVSLSSDGTDVTFTFTTAGLPVLDTNDDQYYVAFVYDNVSYLVMADNGLEDNGDTPLYELTDPAGDQLETLTGSFNTDIGVVTIELPIAGFNAASKANPALGDGAQLIGLRGYTETFIQEEASSAAWPTTSTSTDARSRWERPSTTPALSETAYVPALLVLGAVLGGAGLVRRRRRTSVS